MTNDTTGPVHAAIEAMARVLCARMAVSWEFAVAVSTAQFHAQNEIVRVVPTKATEEMIDAAYAADAQGHKRSFNAMAAAGDLTKKE